MRFVHYALDRPMPLAGTLAILVGIMEAAVDWTTWVQLDMSALYGVPLVLAAIARNRRLMWMLAVCLVFMTFAAYASQIGAPFSVVEPYFINRALSATALALSAVLCDVWIVAANRLAAQRRTMVEQNQELNELRRAAEQANGRKTQLLSAVSHDIRTPLTIIRLIADLILNSTNDPALASRVPGLVQRLHRNTSSLTDLVSALVDISSLDAGRTGASKSEFSLNELLAQECERLLPLAQNKGLRLVTQTPQPPVRLLADRVKLVRILSNLVGNAIKFTHTGVVTVTAMLTPERAPLIRISDTGIGMPPEDLARIFDEYGQLGSAQRDVDKGWGLGLAISRRLAGVLGGEITVESTPNSGSVFSVRLPASCVVGDAPQAPDESAPSRAGVRPAHRSTGTLDSRRSAR